MKALQKLNRSLKDKRFSLGNLSSSLDDLMPAINEEPDKTANNNDTVQRRNKEGPSKPRPKSLNFDV